MMQLIKRPSCAGVVGQRVAVLSILIAMIGLSGCGNKAGLFLPKETASADSQVQETAPTILSSTNAISPFNAIEVNS